MPNNHAGAPVVVIGAGINGLVAANYLRRWGYDVTMVERRPWVGGACIVRTLACEGAEILYPPGPSVFGLMQGFVFEETELSKELDIFTP